MGIFTLDGLFTTTTVDAVKGTIYGYLSAGKFPVTSWVAMSPTRRVVDAVSRLYQSAQAVTVALAKSAFLDTAALEWLKALAEQVYEVTPIAQTFAVGEFVADNAGGGSYDFAIGELAVVKRGTTHTYHNSAAVHIGSLATGVAFPIVADESGADSNAAAGQLALSTSVSGVSGTNQLPCSGLDAEEDEALKDRCRLSRGALSPNGPRAAYEYVARTPELNGGVAISRARQLPSGGTGLVTIVVATSLGAVDPSDVAKIQTGIDTWATPATVLATVVSAGEEAQTVEARVWLPLYGGPNQNDLSAAIKAALVAYVDGLPIGGVQLSPGNGVVPWSGIVATIKNVTLGDSKPVLAVDLLGAGEVNTPIGSNSVATLIDASIVLTFSTVSP